MALTTRFRRLPGLLRQGGQGGDFHVLPRSQGMAQTVQHLVGASLPQGVGQAAVCQGRTGQQGVHPGQGRQGGIRHDVTSKQDICLQYTTVFLP